MFEVLSFSDLLHWPSVNVSVNGFYESNRRKIIDIMDTNVICFRIIKIYLAEAEFVAHNFPQNGFKKNFFLILIGINTVFIFFTQRLCTRRQNVLYIRTLTCPQEKIMYKFIQNFEYFCTIRNVMRNEKKKKKKEITVVFAWKVRYSNTQ